MARDYGSLPQVGSDELVRRYDAEGEAGLEPRSRRPRASSHRTSGTLEDEIVELRKELSDLGVDAGANTIAAHLARHGEVATVPSVATIWRILSRRGFITPQPQKRPRSSYVRLEDAMPNERWQADITDWRLLDGTEVENLNVIDDHSQLLVAPDARGVFKAADVVASFHEAAEICEFQSSLLADNERFAVYTPMKSFDARDLGVTAPRSGATPDRRIPYSRADPPTRGRLLLRVAPEPADAVLLARRRERVR